MAFNDGSNSLHYLNIVFCRDKDVTLLREFFNLQHLDYKDMSPVLIPKGELFFSFICCRLEALSDFGNVLATKKVTPKITLMERYLVMVS
jgi:hypothetical protein